MFNFLPVVTDIAIAATSLNLPSMRPADVFTDNVAEGGSLSPSSDGFDIPPYIGLSPAADPKSIFFNVVVYEGSFGLNSLSQKQVAYVFLLK